jgi:hypothetical protein
VSARGLGWHDCVNDACVWNQTLENLGGVEALHLAQVSVTNDSFFFAGSRDGFLASNGRTQRILDAPCWVCAFVEEYEYLESMSFTRPMSKSLLAKMKSQVVAEYVKRIVSKMDLVDE